MKKFETDKFDVATLLIASRKKLLGITGSIDNPQFVFLHDPEIPQQAKQYNRTSGNLTYFAVTQAQKYLTREFERFVQSRRNNIILASNVYGPFN